ncbi:MAG: 5'-3' exonuclease H3TH domain-containing protein [Patescibacteria group bacterium]
MEKFIIIDGNSLLHRTWHALPKLTTKTGEVVNAVYGFALIFLKILKELKPDYLVVAFDSKKPTFRHQEFKEYKAKRIKQPEEFYAQISRVKQLLEGFKVKYLEIPGYEADDIIGTLCRLISNFHYPISKIIVSGDLDNLQLVDEQTKVYTLKRGITKTVIYDKKTIEEKFGLLPHQLIDFKALCGDPSDNIPGVKGIGEKTALKLIKKFGSLENLYQNLEKIENEKIKNLLKEQKENAFLSKNLVTIKSNLKIDFNLEDLKRKEPDKEKVIKFFQTLEFKSLIPRFLSLGKLSSQKLF